MSARAGGAVATALATMIVLSGCGQEDSSSRERATSGATTEPSADAVGYAVADGTQREAQAAVAAAETALIGRGGARFTLTWHTEGQQMEITDGAFNLRTPAYRQAYTQPEGTMEVRSVPGHAYVQVKGEGVVDELSGCWMHYTTGSGDIGRAAAVPPVAMMLLDPKAVGFRKGSDDKVVVQLLLDEATPAMMPKVANSMAGEIDPAATVPGLLTLQGATYESLEFSAADVIAALGPDQVPAEVAAVGTMAEGLTVRVTYDAAGSPVLVEKPPADRLIDVGNQADLLGGGFDPDSPVETCAAHR